MQVKTTRRTFAAAKSAGVQVFPSTPGRAKSGNGAPSGSTGFKYKDSDGVPDGITSAKLKAGADGKSQVQIRAKGANLLPPETEDLSGVVVQLLIDDGSETQCFKTSFSDAAVSAQDPERFKAKGP